MNKIIITIVAIIFIQLQMDAQMKSANKYYDRLAYNAAIPRFEKVVKKDSSNFEAITKLANCYRMTNDMKKAERAYSYIVKQSNAMPEHLLYYAQSLMENEKYADAATWLAKYKAVASGDKRAENLQEGLQNLSTYQAMENAYTVRKININTGHGEFGATSYNGGIVFVSNRPQVEIIGYSHSWTGSQFYQLYYAKGEEFSFNHVEPFASSLETKYNDGPVAFNATGTNMYFTRNNIENGKVGKDQNDVVRLKIFSTQWDAGKWGIDVPFQYNSDNYSCAHPSISADSKSLYFSSDMPGGAGGMDIWKCNWNGTSWDAPVNLGATINTPGNEIFPTIASDGALYYSSNGLAGLGGLDIYYAKASNSGFAKPLNMGAPINSSDDDFNITFRPDGNSGFFSSNRKAQGTNDDIFFFKKQCTNTDVIIVDETTGEVLSDVEVKVFENNEQKSIMMTDASGKLNLCLNPLSNYEFRATKSDYTENKSVLNSAQIAAAANTGTEVKVPLKKKDPVVVNVKGRVFNADDKSPVGSQTVVMTDKTTGETKTATTDANGQYVFDNIPLNHQFEISTTKKDCGDVKEPFNTNNIASSKTITMDVPLLCKGDIIKIDNIYYDYNKSDIRADAALELDKVVALLNKYPTMVIELRSHTDSRGKDDYNRNLSDKRAKSAVEYIISRGISANRLTGKGYGESELLNRCKNGVECDEKEHEMNRRTEFKILSM